RLRPATVLRRDLGESAVKPVRPLSGKLVIVALVGAGIAALAAGLPGSWTSAWWPAASFVGCLAMAWLAAGAALWVIRRASILTRVPPPYRLGIRNLVRPGGNSRMLVTAIASGLMLLIATYQVSGAVMRALRGAIPFDRADLFVAGFEDRYREQVRTFLARLPGIEGDVQIATLARLRLESVDNVPIEQIQKEAAERDAVVDRWYIAGCADRAMPPGPSSATVTVAADVARQLGARVGSTLRFAGRDRTISASVVATRAMTPVEKYWYAFRLDCREVDPHSLFHHAAARVRPGEIRSVRRAVNATYPALAVITGSDLTETVSAVGGDALALVRMVAWYAIGAGMCVLLAVAAVMQAYRLREIGIVRALGGTHSVLLRIYTTEFAAVGTLAAALGCVMAALFTVVLMGAVLHRYEPPLDWRSILTAMIATPLLTVCAGWLATFPLLRGKPLEVLRRE
ncbi:MAG: FtsX-like permease family protein, partial [Bryobacteraceae bacterium]